jgi:transcriptional regulator, TetR family
MLIKKIKKDKKEILMNSATNLFKTKGIYSTTVSDIVKDAGIAKGTFYLYFSDKDEVVNAVIMKEANILLNKAIEESKTLENAKLSEKIVFIADHVIDVFLKNKSDLEIIHKNLYKGLFSKDENGITLFSKAVDEFISYNKYENKEKIQKKLYIIIEMVGGVCYNSIYNNMPYDIFDIKEELFEAIGSIVSD